MIHFLLINFQLVIEKEKEKDKLIQYRGIIKVMKGDKTKLYLNKKKIFEVFNGIKIFIEIQN